MLSRKKRLFFFIFGVTIMALILGSVTVGVIAKESVKLTMWRFGPREEIWQGAIKRFEQKYPEITVDLVEVPVEEMTMKLRISVVAGTNPDMVPGWNFTWDFMRDKQLAVYPENIFAESWIRENLFASELYKMPEGYYTFSFGIMGPQMYYNKGIWEKAGLSEGDVPKAWSELRNVAKKLTKYDSKGKMTQSGFAFNGYYQYIIHDFRAQSGGYMYSEDLSEALWNSPESMKGTQFLHDLMFKDRVCEADFIPYNEAFGTEKAAIVQNWTWFSGYLDANYPEVDYVVIRIPTPDGELRPDQYGMCGIEGQFPIVFKNIPSDNKEAAWKFIKSLTEDSQWGVEYAIDQGIIPTNLLTWARPELWENQTMRVLAQTVPYYTAQIYYPDEIRSLLNTTCEKIFVLGEPMRETWNEATKKANELIAENKYERMEYRHFMTEEMARKLQMEFEKRVR